MSFWKGLGIAIGALVALFLFIWTVQGNNFFMYKVLAPATEQVRRETFEETKAYRQGMVQELQNMQFEYVKADAEHKVALADIILRRAADFPKGDMTPDLAQFIDQLKLARTNPQ